MRSPLRSPRFLANARTLRTLRLLNLINCPRTPKIQTAIYFFNLYLAIYLKNPSMKTRIYQVLAMVILISGCAEVTKVLETTGVPAPLTETEVISGLKEALTTGAKNAAQKLAVENGYYGDQAVKILLPDEAKVIVDNISKLPGGEKLVEDVILRINRAAEDAAKEAAPIFVNSITQMTISDAFSILKGQDNAATQYLRKTTYSQLYSLYKPKMQASTEKKIIGGISTRDSWNTLTGKWNTLANSIAGKVAGLKAVNTDLDDYLTNKALNGMFMKVEQEEYKIRKDVSARISPVLQRVFGSLDHK
jgi:Protein of unknown function (DUF4197)